MTLRSLLVERFSPLKKRLKIETPVINEVPAMARIISSAAIEFPEFLGKVPVMVRGKVYGETAGLWYRVTFPRGVSEPSVAAVAEGRVGAIPSVSAPKIKVQTPVPVDIPVTVIPYVNESFPYLVSDIDWVRDQICKPVNSVVASLYRVQGRINDAIGRINQGFAKTKDSFEGTNTSISDLRTKTEDSVNQGLANLIPSLYAAWGLPSTMIITPIHIRNVTSTGFEFQSYGKTTCYYIAVGSRL